jgi:hypothetical protein
VARGETTGASPERASGRGAKDCCFRMPRCLPTRGAWLARPPQSAPASVAHTALRSAQSEARLAPAQMPAAGRKRDSQQRWIRSEAAASGRRRASRRDCPSFVRAALYVWSVAGRSQVAQLDRPDCADAAIAFVSRTFPLPARVPRRRCLRPPQDHRRRHDRHPARQEKPAPHRAPQPLPQTETASASLGALRSGSSTAPGTTRPRSALANSAPS